MLVGSMGKVLCRFGFKTLIHGAGEMAQQFRAVPAPTWRQTCSPVTPAPEDLRLPPACAGFRRAHGTHTYMKTRLLRHKNVNAMVPFTSDRVLSKIHCFFSGEMRVIIPSIT